MGSCHENLCSSKIHPLQFQSRQFSSAAERRPCKAQAVGSIPTTGFRENFRQSFLSFMARGGRRTYTRDANGRFASSSGGGGSLASARKASSPKSARKPPSASKAKPSTGKAKPAAKSASNGAPSRAERNRIMGETQKKAQAAYNAAKAKGKGKRAQEAVYRRVIDQGLVKVGLKKPSLGTRIAKGISRALGR
jgi:hypothetical protein